MVEHELLNIIMEKAKEKDLLEDISNKVAKRTMDPYSAKDEILGLIGK